MPISILLFFGIVFVLVCCLRLMNVAALVAFLFAGIVSGPHMLNLFELNQTWTFLGQLGILFLWFNIGLGINMRRLWDLKHTIFGFGAAQVMMVAIMLFPLLFEFTSWSITGAVMVSLILAMSSTSEDLQILIHRNQLNTSMGRQTFSILLFQDLLSIPLLAMIPAFAGKSFNLGASVIDVLVISVALVLSVIIVGRFVLNPLLRVVARLKSREAFLLAVMLNIVVWAVLIDLLGLPAGLGAFLAGMLMSETIYSHQICAEISPYSLLFLSLFFIALGMELNLPMLASKWYLVLGGLIGFVAIKFFAIFVVARVRGVAVQDAVLIALILAQGGEFGLLMLQTLQSSGINAIPAPYEEVLTAIIILSIMITPIMLSVYDRMQRNGKLFAQRHQRDLAVDTANNYDVIVCGFGRVGQIISQMLDAQNIPYIAIDMDVNSVMIGRERGFNVVYGDCTNSDVLCDFGLRPRKTRAVVVALDNGATVRDAVLTVKSIAPRVKVFARARNLADSKSLLKEGVTQALPETIESSFRLACGVLGHLGVSDDAVSDMLADMRANNYAMLDNNTSDLR